MRTKIRSNFSTTNGVNAFDLDDRSHTENGYRLGGGVETMFGPIAVGLLYLYTSVKDKDTRVAVMQGTAGATNPFILVNPARHGFPSFGRPLQEPLAEPDGKLSLWRPRRSADAGADDGAPAAAAGTDDGAGTASASAAARSG